MINYIDKSGDYKIFEKICEHEPDAKVIVNSEEEILFINIAAENLFGYHREDLLGKTVETLIPERFRSRHFEYFKKFFDDPHTRSFGYAQNLYGLYKDGKEFPVDIMLSPLKTETDQGLLVVAIVRNITERKKKDKEFETLVQERTLELKKSNGALMEKANELTESYKTLEEEIVIREQMEESLKKYVHSLEKSNQTKAMVYSVFADALIRDISDPLNAIIKICETKNGKEFDEIKSISESIITTIKNAKEEYIGPTIDINNQQKND